jgi:hypothetical protein
MLRDGAKSSESGFTVLLTITISNHAPFQPPRLPIDATTELTAELDRSRAQRDAALSARKGRMSLSRKYAFVLALALASALAVAVIYAYVPLTREDIAKLRWLDDINVIVSKSVALAKPHVGFSPVDPIAAANVDEDLDYRIALRTKSPEGWRSFLAAHPDGPHAQSARVEIDNLVAVETPLAPPVAEASNAGSSDTKPPKDLASPDLTSPPPEVATHASDESANATRSVWDGCPRARQAMKLCDSSLSCAARSYDQGSSA